LINQRTL